MFSNPVAVTSRVSVPQSCRLETPVSEVSRTNRGKRQVPTMPSYGRVEQSTEGTWTEELQRRHQTALMKEIKEQILFKPIDHFSLTSAFDKDSSEQFPRRSKSSASKHQALIDKLGDLSKSSPSPSSSGYLQCQRTEPLPLDQAVGQGSTVTNGGTLISSAPQVVSSKSKFFKVGTPVELFDRRHATGSTVSTPQHAVSPTPTPIQHGTDPSSTWTPTPKTQEFVGAEAVHGEETTRTFNQTAVSSYVAATPRHQTACSVTTSALRTPNTHPVSAPMSWANGDSDLAQMRAVSEWNNRPCKNVSTLTLNQAKMRRDTILTPCNLSSSTVMSSPTVRPTPHSNPCRKDVLSSSLRQPQGTKLFLTPGKRVSWKPESVWHTPNGSFSRSTSASQKIESEVPREKGVDHAYDQNTILRVASMTPRKGLSLALLSNQNFSPQPNFSSSVRFEQGNTASATRSPKHTIVEVVPESPENSTGIDMTPQQLIASKEVEEPTHKSLHHEDSNRAQQTSVFESSNNLTVTAVQESCSVCGCGTAKVDKACQTVPYYATTGTMFGSHMSARA
ncbi:flocculation protein FLO11 [Ixodes scapularis]|uniref:flocculation protein FLO11 n=1 Tax=Ixodes scapularis TaxID=6945 RepID=UPI001C38FE4B|nr:flocculation protein FLO11 [Ixodes scapularis]